MKSSGETELSQEINDQFIFKVERVDETQPRCSQDFGDGMAKIIDVNN